MPEELELIVSEPGLPNESEGAKKKARRERIPVIDGIPCKPLGKGRYMHPNYCTVLTFNNYKPGR